MSTFKFLFLLFVLSMATMPGKSQEINLSALGYDMHAELNWPSLAGADRYQIWRKAENDPSFALLTTTRKLRWQDWTGREEMQADHYQYYVEALSVPGMLLGASDTIDVVISPFADDQFLDMVQAYTFRYFYDYGHPTSGMARERLGSGDVVTTGGTGFGIMALITGIRRGLITREEGVSRILKIVSFLQFADRFHGVFPHWMNGKNGDVIAFSTFDNGGDLVETAFLMQGLLCARSYFNQDIETENVLREVITGLWEEVEWDFYSKNNSGVLYWHWSPQYAWQMNFPIRGYNEGLIVYLLAIASPTHPVEASYYHTGWAGAGYVNGNTWYGYKLYVGPNFGGPLFFAHYSFMGFDPRNLKDAYCNYFDQNHNHTMINRSWCVTNPLHHEGYGETCWGLTASDDPWGYSAHAPGAATDNGTITPAAAIPSMPYTPEVSIAALKHFYRDHGPQLWGEFGFYDAFNTKEDWFADSYLAIDQGPIINMIENYRTGLLWENFMANEEIAPALDAIGFVPDPVSNENLENNYSWKVFPTINQGEFYLTGDEMKGNQNYEIMLHDLLGRPIPFESVEVDEQTIRMRLTDQQSSQGWIWISRLNEFGVIQTQPVWIF